MKYDSDQIIALYRQLLTVSQQEQKALCEDRIEELTHFLTEKDSILEELRKTNTDPPPDLTKFQRNEIEGLIKQIMEINKSNEEKVRLIQDKMKSELTDMDKGHRAIKAYKAYSK
ncbi:MAG: flagellar protein FliT [Nitrospira sp.]|nr:flagellar protein FliT [Candidatus Brocadiales bacterium]MBL7050085.1 flagellar protein FliT [Nitrospira sp.]